MCWADCSCLVLSQCVFLPGYLPRLVVFPTRIALYFLFLDVLSSLCVVFPGYQLIDSDSEADSGFDGVTAVRSLLKLDSATVEELLEVFEACEEGGNITSTNFERCLRAVMISKGATSQVITRFGCVLVIRLSHRFEIPVWHCFCDPFCLIASLTHPFSALAPSPFPHTPSAPFRSCPSAALCPTSCSPHLTRMATGL